MGSGPFDVMRNGMRNIMRDVMRCMKCAVQNPVRSRNEVHFMNLIQPNRLKGRQWSAFHASYFPKKADYGPDGENV